MNVVLGGIMLDDVKEEQDEYVSKHSGGGSSSGGKDEGLSSKIDTILREAKLDVGLVSGLTKSIQNLENTASSLSPASDAAASSQNYAEELNKAAGQLQSLNQLYASQVKNAGQHNNYNEQVSENAELLRSQMQSLSENLASLNQVYKGMLFAMNKN
jgi:hypothetical protein